MKNFKNLDEFLEYVSKHNLDGIDSEHTLNTKKLVKQFGANGVDMNSNWALRSFDWQCPCCNRSKSQIIRLNRHGDLICHLHEHHDHTPDIAKELFTDAGTSKTKVVADKASERFVKKISNAFESYSPTVICPDCNSADTNAKKAAQTHKWFSFSPMDIETMIEVRDNREHTVKIEKAIEIWNRKREIFDRRIELIKEFIKIAANKNDWYEQNKQSYLKDFREFHEIPLEMRSWLYTTKDYSKKTIKNRSEWRIKPKNKFYNTPVGQEIEFAINTSQYPYHTIPDNWRCSICDRSKHEAFQKSKAQNQWGMRREVVTFYDGKRASICNECLATIRAVKNEICGNTTAAPTMINIDEAKSFILAKPHNNHAINNDILNGLLDIFKGRLTDNERLS